MYEKFKKIAALFENGVMYTADEVYQKLASLEEEGFPMKGIWIFSKEAFDECEADNLPVLIQERRKTKELKIEEIQEEKKVFRKRIIAILKFDWSAEAEYVRVYVEPHFSHWVVSTHEEDTGSIQWIETEEGVLYRTPIGWEVFASAEVLDSGMDWSYHDGATFPRVRFMRKDGSVMVATKR